MRKLALVILMSSVMLLLFWPRSAPVVPEQNLTPGSELTAEPEKVATLAQDTTVKTLQVTERQQVALQQHFAQVAAWYQDELAYPAYARPLTREDLQLLHPNHYVVQTVPLQGNASAAIVLPQYRFLYPATVPVLLQYSGLDIYEAELQLRSTENGELLTQETLRATAEGFSVELQPAANWQGELAVQITFRALGQQQQLLTAIDYQQPTAHITGVASAYAEQADLVIPVEIEVQQAGTYRLRANLFNNDGQPLAHLTMSAYLQTGQQQLALKAIKSVLAGQAGPYQLTTLILERRSGSPGELARYGSSEHSQYHIEFNDYDRLSAPQHQPDEAELQRLQFLQQMAGSD